MKSFVVEFPKSRDININMMPFIMGDLKTLPEQVSGYFPIIDRCQLEKGKIVYLTITESFVNVGEFNRRCGIHTDYDEYIIQGIYTSQELAEATLELLNDVYRSNMDDREKKYRGEHYVYWELEEYDTDYIYEKRYLYKRGVDLRTGIIYDQNKSSIPVVHSREQSNDHFVGMKELIWFNFSLVEADDYRASQYTYSTYKALLLMLQKGIEWMNKV